MQKLQHQPCWKSWTTFSAGMLVRLVPSWRHRAVQTPRLATNWAFWRELLLEKFTTNLIVMKFNTYLLDGSPYKLYDALKEIALNADKVDDLLLDEFDALMPIDTKHVVTVSKTEKATKYRYIRQWIETTLNTIKELESNHPTVFNLLLPTRRWPASILNRPLGECGRSAMPLRALSCDVSCARTAYSRTSSSRRAV